MNTKTNTLWTSFQAKAKPAIKFACHVGLIFLAAYGLRHMFAAIKEELSLVLTVVFTILLAWTAHTD